MTEFLHGSGVFLLYLLPMAAIFLTIRVFVKIPDELFRKLLHFILLGAYLPLVFAFETWWMPAGLVTVLALLLYPVLTLASRIPGFAKFTTQRREGEFVSSMLLALTTMALSVTICWGICGDRYLVLVCVYAWGVGDAFAALIGKRFGRHKIHLPFADPHKSVEGTFAMFLTSAIAVLTVLLIRGGMPFGSCLLIALVAAYVELCTKGGYDTVTCPAAAMAVVLPLIKILGG